MFCIDGERNGERETWDARDDCLNMVSIEGSLIAVTATSCPLLCGCSFSTSFSSLICVSFIVFLNYWGPFCPGGGGWLDVIKTNP